MKTGLSFMFAAGDRPSAADVAQLANSLAAARGFSIVHDPGAQSGWLELLHMGLTFDLRGLEPGKPEPQDEPLQSLGIDAGLARDGLEAISLVPGPHLAESGALLPVIRAIVALGTALAGVRRVRAVVWHPAGSWMEPGYFGRIAGDWLEGGAFPSLGLTSIGRRDDGNLLTTGLALFTGQELLLEPREGASAGDAARLAVRLIDEFVFSGPLLEAATYSGPGGETLNATAENGGTLVRVKWVS